MDNYSDMINGGEGYRSFSDFFILRDEPFNFNILKQNAIIFCKIDYIESLFLNLRFSNKKYILITHYSDYDIDKNKFSKKPACIKKWYGLCVTYEHPDIIPIPIGFGIHWDPFPEKLNKEWLDWYFNNAELLSLIEKDNKTVYCNFTIDHMRPNRALITQKLSENGVNSYSPSTYPLPFPEYCEDMARFKFIACPKGNGNTYDTHRLWEALYIGCIPIVIKNLVFRNYDLPILQVKDYSEVTPKLLEDYLNYYTTHKFNWDHAKLSYWKNRIQNELKEL